MCLSSLKQTFLTIVVPFTQVYSLGRPLGEETLQNTLN